MATFDVRESNTEEITEIVFADKVSKKEYHEGSTIAYKLSNGIFTYIEDADSSVRIESKQHALNLIKALNKAIELGWLK